MDDNKTEIRPPTKSWRLQNKPINSILIYKGWVYCAGTVLEGSSLKVCIIYRMSSKGWMQSTNLI